MRDRERERERERKKERKKKKERKRSNKIKSASSLIESGLFIIKLTCKLLEHHCDDDDLNDD